MNIQKATDSLPLKLPSILASHPPLQYDIVLNRFLLFLNPPIDCRHEPVCSSHSKAHKVKLLDASQDLALGIEILILMTTIPTSTKGIWIQAFNFVELIIWTTASMVADFLLIIWYVVEINLIYWERWKQWKF